MKKKLWNEDWFFYTDSDPSEQRIDLPHDAMLHGTRSPKSKGKDAVGYFEGDVYHYKKYFCISKEEGTHHVIQFDGVYQNTTVLLNGQKLCTHHYGYTPFETVLDPTLSYTEENCLEVIADNSMLPNSRWYSGGGIYRDVTFLSSGEHYIMPDCPVRLQSTRTSKFRSLMVNRFFLRKPVRIVQFPCRTQSCGQMNLLYFICAGQF